MSVGVAVSPYIEVDPQQVVEETARGTRVEHDLDEFPLTAAPLGQMSYDEAHERFFGGGSEGD